MEGRVTIVNSHNSYDRAYKALKASAIPDLRGLCLEEVEGSLVISGRVGSFYHKQLAQELVRSVARERELVNTVDVD